MFKITEDTYLQEGKFLCPDCGAANYYYFDHYMKPIDYIIYRHCQECKNFMRPKPGLLIKNQTYRIIHHFSPRYKANAEKKKEERK